MRPSNPIPPLPVLARALRETTERLAHELAHPSSSRPEWNGLEWDMARAAAAVQGVGPLLASRLAWTGPDRWQHFLEGQLQHGIRREAIIRSLLGRLDEAT